MTLCRHHLTALADLCSPSFPVMRRVGDGSGALWRCGTAGGVGYRDATVRHLLERGLVCNQDGDAAVAVTEAGRDALRAQWPEHPVFLREEERPQLRVV